jgi:hypothetical protein
MMQQQSPISWLAKCGLGAAVLLAVWGVATAWVGVGYQLPATTTRDATLQTLDRYVEESIPDVVLVGSSLTYRLSEEYFATPRLRNLALAGGSPITGFDVVLAQRRFPKIVLVETNVLSRTPDDTVAARYLHRKRAEPRLLRPIRAAAAVYENLRHARPSREEVVAAMAGLLKQPPSDFDNRIYLERAVKGFDDDPSNDLQANVKRLAEQVERAQKLGVRVMLFELPFPTELQATRHMEITRRIVRARFPDFGEWLPLDLDPTQLRWLDGVHLDERSAMLVSRSIDKALGPMLLAKSSRTD